MKLRPGLHAQFLLVMAGALLGVTVLIGMLLHRQHRMQDEVEDLSRDAMGTMASESRPTTPARRTSSPPPKATKNEVTPSTTTSATVITNATTTVRVARSTTRWVPRQRRLRVGHPRWKTTTVAHAKMPQPLAIHHRNAPVEMIAVIANTAVSAGEVA